MRTMNGRSQLLSSRRHCGATLVEMLVSLLVVGVVLMAGFRSFYDTNQRTKDDILIAVANETARTTLDFLVYDLRMAGSGMPLGQSGFSLTDATLGTYALPILLDATATELTVRMNERGIDTILTADFNPAIAGANPPVSVLSNADVRVGDVIYLSDRTIGLSDGLRAVVSAKTGNTLVNLTTPLAYTPNAVFRAGTTFNRVSTVTYRSVANWGGITRYSTDTTPQHMTLAENANFSLQYLDFNGNVMEPPLTAVAVRDLLASVAVTVNARSSQPLSNGSIYQATAVQEVTLRNLILSR